MHDTQIVLQEPSGKAHVFSRGMKALVFVSWHFPKFFLCITHGNTKMDTFISKSLLKRGFSYEIWRKRKDSNLRKGWTFTSLAKRLNKPCSDTLPNHSLYGAEGGTRTHDNRVETYDLTNLATSAYLGLVVGFEPTVTWLRNKRFAN